MRHPHFDLIKQRVEEGLVVAKRHWYYPLTIYTYSFDCQMYNRWDEATMACRGLILDDYGEVIARPFEKFFNDNEPKPEQPPWDLPFEVQEKVDGSLLIVFYYGGQWYTATKGKFDSIQAMVGLDILRSKYRYDLNYLDIDYTYLFELVYPENQIVVDYAGEKDVYLLAAINRDTGVELPTDNLPTAFKRYRTFDVGSTAIPAIRESIPTTDEGFVLRFSNGYRLKVKSEGYCALHRLLSDMNTRRIWEFLSQGGSLEQIKELFNKRSDQAVAQWGCMWADTYVQRYKTISDTVDEVVKYCERLSNRKSIAAYIMEKCGKEYCGAAFAKLDGYPHERLIWKALHPKYVDKPPRNFLKEE